MTKCTNEKSYACGFRLGYKKTAPAQLHKVTNGLKYRGGFEKPSADILNTLDNKTKIITSFIHSSGRTDRDVFIIRALPEN